MRRLWMVAAVALVAACQAENKGEQAVGAERQRPPEQPGAQPPAQGEPREATIGVFIVDTEPNATARLLATAEALGQAEIAAAQLAMDKSASEEVKSYARTIIDDNQQELRQIEQLARDKKLDVQGALDADPTLRAHQQSSQQTLEALRGLSGEAFDAAFMREQPSAHVFLEQIAQQGQRVSSDPQIDAFFSTVQRDAQQHRSAAMKALPVACGGQLVQPGGEQPQQR